MCCLFSNLANSRGFRSIFLNSFKRVAKSTAEVPLFILRDCASLSLWRSMLWTKTNDDKILCYYASWGVHRPGSGKFTPEDIKAEYCTHIFYAFLGLNENGTLKILDEDFDIKQGGFKRVSDLKKRNSNLKTLFSIGGAAAGTGPFSSIAASSEKRAVMIKSALDLIQKYNYDGIDIDWEYPWGGQDGQYVTLLSDLKEAFRPHGYLVTVAVAPNPSEVNGYNIPEISKVLDIINVMTYDFYGQIGYTVQNSPLYGSSLESSWQREYRNANASITAWIKGGADPQKVAIGVPFYGHTFYLGDPSNGALHAPTKGPYKKGPYTDNEGSLGYAELCEFHSNGTVTWDDEQKVPYLHDGEMWAGYDNEKSVALKVKYAKQHNLAGVFIWSIETDDRLGFCGKKYALIDSVYNAMNS